MVYFNYGQIRRQARRQMRKQRRKATRMAPKSVSANTSIMRSIKYSAFNPRKRCVLKWAEKYTIAITSSNIQNNRFVNSIFDPIQTSTTHQPYKYNQLEPLYTLYKVTGMKCTIDVVNNGEDAGLVALSAKYPATGPSTYYQLIENDNSHWMTVPGRHQGQEGHRRMTRYFSMPVVAGLTRSQFNSEELFQSLFNSNPPSILNVFASFTPHNQTGSFDGSFIMYIDYYVEVFAPKVPPSS